MHASLLIDRRAAIRAGGAGVAASLLAMPVASVAQDATPAESDQLPAVLANWLAAWSVMDIDAIADLFAEDGSHVDLPRGMVTTGREAIRERFGMTAAAIPDSTVEILNVFGSADGAHGAIEWVFSGTYSGTLPGLPPGDGQPLSFAGASMIDMTEDAITEERWYYDVFTLLVQTGVLPPPEAAPSATPAT